MRLFTIILFSCLLSVLLINKSHSQSTADSLALVALYNSTDGANWTDQWDLDQPVSTWDGIYMIQLFPEGVSL